MIVDSGTVVGGIAPEHGAEVAQLTRSIVGSVRRLYGWEPGASNRSLFNVVVPFVKTALVGCVRGDGATAAR
jgi:hypothetical protein